MQMNMGRGEKKAYAVALAGLALVFSLNLAGSAVRARAYRAADPVQRELVRIGDALVSAFGSTAGMQEDLRRLRAERNALQASVADLTRFREENQELREAFELDALGSSTRVAGDVVARDLEGGRMLVRVPEGSGVEQGNPVITAEGALAGSVDSVVPGYAWVHALFRSGSSFDARVPGTEAVGVVRGEGTEFLLFDRIPRHASLQEGDLVVTSSLGSRFPEGLAVGSVQSVRREAAELFQQAEVAPSFLIRDTRVLFILSNWKP